MGKQKGPKFDIKDAFKTMGVGDLTNSQAVKEADIKSQELQRGRAYQPETLQPAYQKLNKDLDVYKDLLNPGEWGMQNVQNLDDAVSDNQSRLGRIANAVPRFLALTPMKLWGQAAGLAHSIDSVIGRDDENAMTDEKLQKTMAETQAAEQAIKEFFPIYEHSSYKDAGVLETLASSQFWTDTMSDGLAFVGAMAIGTKGMAGAMGNAGRLFGAAKAVNKLGKLKSIADNIPTATISVFNSASTASMQGEQAYTETIAQLQGRVDPDTGDLYTEEKARTKAGEAAAQTWNSTFWMHMIPSIWETRTILGLGKASSELVGSETRKRLIESLKKGNVSLKDIYADPSKHISKNVFRSGLRKGAIGAALEGPYEENIENAIVNSSVDNVINSKNNNFLGSMDSYMDEMLSNFSDPAALKEILVGSIIGGGMGNVSGMSEARGFNKGASKYISGMQAADLLYRDNMLTPFKTAEEDTIDSKGNKITAGSLILDENGTPVVDETKLVRLTKQILADQNLADDTTQAFLSGNPENVKINENLSLSSAVYSALEEALAHGDTPEGAMELLSFRLNAQIDEMAADQRPTPSEENSQDVSTQEAKRNAEIAKQKNNVQRLLSTIRGEYDKAKSRAELMLTDSSTPEEVAFSGIVKKNLLYEATKRISYDQLVEEFSDRLADPLEDQEAIAEKIKSLNDRKAESFEASKSLLSNPGEAFKAWNSKLNTLRESRDTLSRLNKEVLSTAEVETRDVAEYNLELAKHLEGDFYGYVDPRLNIDPSLRVKGRTGRRASAYEEVGKEKITAKKVREELEAGNIESASNLIGLLRERNEGLAKLVRDQIEGKQQEIQKADEDVDKLFSSPDLTDEASITMDEILRVDNMEYANTNSLTPEMLETLGRYFKAKEDAKKLDEIEKSLESKSDVKRSEMDPNTFEDTLEKEYRERSYKIGDQITTNAIDSFGNISEDYTDVAAVERSIKAISKLRNVIKDKIKKNDTQELQDELARIESLLDTLGKIKESAILNKHNREGKQKAISQERYNELLEVINLPEVFEVVNSALNGTLPQKLEQIDGLSEYKLEAINALFAHVKNLEGKKISRALRKRKAQEIVKFKEQLKESLPNNPEIAKQLNKNPYSSVLRAWLMLNNRDKATHGSIVTVKGSPYFKFRTNQSFSELVDLLESGGEFQADVEELKYFATSGRLINALNKANFLVSADRDTVMSLMGMIDDNQFVPTVQQEITLREMASWWNLPVDFSKPYDSWGYLKGVAGTGKTNITLKWAVGLMGLSPEQVIGTSRTEKATSVLANSLGVPTTTFGELDINAIGEDVKLIVIDEYATIPKFDLQTLEEQVRNLNEIRKEPLRVLLLGDPTQISANFSEQYDLIQVNNASDSRNMTENITQFSPLTVVYRSDISGINEVSDIFQGNTANVEEVMSRASVDIDTPLAIGTHVISTPAKIIETINRNREEEGKSNRAPRSRAIIVGSEADVAKYSQVEGVEVLPVSEAQSATYDEVYVDINPKQYTDPAERNTAYYTAVSRAKQYVQLVHNGSTVTDNSLEQEKSKNLGSIKESKEEFRVRKTAEAAFLDALDEGKSMKTVKPEEIKSKVEVETPPSGEVTTTGSSLSVDYDNSIEEELASAEEDASTENIETVGEEAITDTEERTDVAHDTVRDPDGSVPPTIVNNEYESAETSMYVPNIDSEAYNAFKSGDLGSDSTVIAVKDKDSGEVRTYVHSPYSGNWYALNRFTKNDVLPEYLSNAITTSKAKPVKVKEFEKDLKSNKWTPDQATSFINTVAHGTIGRFDPMTFTYSPSVTYTNVVDHIVDKFKGFFGSSPTQKAREKSVQMKIFTVSELSNARNLFNTPSLNKIQPGLPYLVIGHNGQNYRDAFFVPLQPKGLKDSSTQVQTLREFRDAVASLQHVAGLSIGTESFSDFIKVVKHGLDIVVTTNEDGTTTPQVVIKPDFSVDDYLAALERMNENAKDSKTGKSSYKNALSELDADQQKDAIRYGLKVASMIYGYKKQNKVFTQEEINNDNKTIEAGDEIIAVPVFDKPNQDGSRPDAFYAYSKKAAEGKRTPKEVYKKSYVLDASKGIAQIQLNQLARSNEYVGGTRIRSSQYVKGARRAVGTGKSLLSHKGGNTRLFQLANLFEAKLDIFKSNIPDFPFMDEDNSLNKKVFRSLVKEQASSPSEELSMIASTINSYIQQLPEGDVKADLNNYFNKIVNETKETLPISLETLDKIVDPSNFQGGRHMSSQDVNYKNHFGDQMTGPVYLRTPLNMKAFNDLGADPVKNKEELNELVSTQFSDVSPTKAAINFGTQTAERAQVEPTIEETLVTASESTANKIDELNAKLLDPNTDPSEIDGILSELERLNNENNRRAYSSSEARKIDKDKVISVAKAKKLFKKLLPSSTEEEIVFLSKMLLDKFANPNENLLGLYVNNRVNLLNDNGTTSEKVLRHEVFHKVFNEYLTPSEQQRLIEALSPDSQITSVEAEEKLADLFMNYNRGSSAWLPNFLNKILKKIQRFFGLIDANEQLITDVFDNIIEGRYTEVVAKPNTRRAYSSVTKDFGNSANFREALAYVRGIVYEDIIAPKDFNQLPLTLEESYDHVKNTLLRKLDTNKTQLATYEKLIGSRPEMKDRLAPQIESLQENISIIERLLPERENGRSEKVLKELWKVLYPNYSFVERKSYLVDTNTGEQLNVEDLSDSELDELTLSGLRDHVIQSDSVNQESKMSDKVKNFLSFIYNSEQGNKHVSHRKAYFEALRAMNEMVTGSGDVSEQLKYQADKNGIILDGGTDTAAVIDSILNLFHEATRTSTTIVQGDSRIPIELNGTYKFENENRYYDSNPNSANHVIERLPGQSTAKFLGQIIHRETVTNYTPDMDVELVRQTIIASFRQKTAQETARELFSLMTSQTEYNYMIGQKERKFSEDTGTYENFYRYIEAQSNGFERSTMVDVEDAIESNWNKIPKSTWDSILNASNPRKGLATFYEKVLDMPITRINKNKAKTVLEAIRGFKYVVDTEIPVTGPKSRIIDEETGETELMGVRYYLTQGDSKLVRDLAKLANADKAESRPTTLRDTTGKSRFVFANGSQARETISRIIKYIDNDGIHNAFTGKDKAEKLQNSLPPIFRTVWGKQNIFVNGINKIFTIRDHDGQRDKNNMEFGVSYADETETDFLRRNFTHGFLQSITQRTGKNEKPRYTQFFYTISNRPRIVAAEVEALDNKGINDAIGKMIDQMFDQPDITSVKNYDPSKMINATLLKSSIETVLGTEFNRETWNKYKTNGFTYAQKKAIIDLTKAKLRTKAEEVFESLKRTDVVTDFNTTGAVAKLKTSNSFINPFYDEGVDGSGNQTEYIDENGKIASDAVKLDTFKQDTFNTVYSFVANNYINSYFLNQTVVGNYNFFKHSEDLVKRMSGVFAPGLKGLMDNDQGTEIFMRPKYRAAVMKDPKLNPSELSEIFKGTALEDVASPKTDIADAQGFITPERAREIERGYGQSYKRGAIIKPAYYGQAIKNIDGVDVAIPVMIKYSAVELTNDLVARYPKLRALRDMMENAKVDELVFDSANKVGVPGEDLVLNEKGEVVKDNRKMPSTSDQSWDDLNLYSIPENSVYDLDNENYRLQLNPSAHAYGDISTPTQLMYFMNTAHDLLSDKKTAKRNKDAATRSYKAFADLVDLGIKRMKSGPIKGRRISRTAIIKSMSGQESMALRTIMENGRSYNLPQIVDKALIQFMNMFAKATIKPKFKGGHFTLQASYGTEIIGSSNPNYTSEYQAYESPQGKAIADELGVSSRNLKYKKTADHKIVAEVILPREFADKAKVGDFIMPGAVGFRIPSTGLHSAVALEVVGYYDAKDSNVIIAPMELVLQHGSDFDVDSLYVLGREAIQTDKYEAYGFPKGTVPGYYSGKGPSGRNALTYQANQFETQISRVPVTMRDELYEMFYKNTIVESLISVVSDEGNLQTIAEPISTESIQKALSSLGISDKKQGDLSYLMDNMYIYNSNFQGAKLIGIFANGAKSLAYMLRAGENGSIPNIKYFGEPDELTSGVDLFGTRYNKFSEIAGNYNIWQVLDALINSAVDNVKEQQLYLMNATDVTGKYFIAGLGLGIPLENIIEFMLQPVSKAMTANKGKADKVKQALVDQLITVDPTVANDWESITEMALFNEVSAEKAKEYRNKRIDELTTKEEVLDQVNLYLQLMKLHKVAEDVTKFSKALSVLQDLPIDYTSIRNIESKWEGIIEVDEEGNPLIEEETGYVIPKGGFSFDIKNLFNAQPNIQSAYKAFTTAKNAAYASFVKHHPVINQLSELSVRKDKIRISYKNSETDMKNEIFSYFLSAMYSEQMKQMPAIKYTVKGGRQKVALGKTAWSHEFANYISEVKKANPDNIFLKGMTVTENYGLKKIDFVQTSGKDFLETIEMQEGFQTLPDDMTGILPGETLKQALVKYAVMNFGMRFGHTSYSAYLDAESLSELDEYINGNLKDFLGDIEDVEAFFDNSPFMEAFSNQMAVNKSTSISYYRSKKRPAVKMGQINTGIETTPILSGYENGIWFNRKFELEKDSTPPNFYQENDGQRVYKLVSTRDSDNGGSIAYYQLLGWRNHTGGYNAVPLAEANNVKLNLFDGTILPVPTSDMNASIQEVGHMPVENLRVGETVWLYSSNDPTRLYGKPVKVEKVIPDSSGAKNSIKVTHLSDFEQHVEMNKAEYKVTPIVQEMQNRFNVKVNLVPADQMPKGRRKSKGTIYNGQIYLNATLLSDQSQLSETAFHEISHPIVAEIAKRNPKWYQNLKDEFMANPQGKVLLEKFKSLYPEFDQNTPEGLDQAIQEGIVTLLGESAVNQRSLGEKLKNYLDRVKHAIANFILSLFKGSVPQELEVLSKNKLAAINLNDLAAMIGSKDGKFRVDLSESINEDWNSKILSEMEEKLFNEGRITLTCKV